MCFIDITILSAYRIVQELQLLAALEQKCTLVRSCPFRQTKTNAMRRSQGHAHFTATWQFIYPMSSDQGHGATRQFTYPMFYGQRPGAGPTQQHNGPLTQWSMPSDQGQDATQQQKLIPHDGSSIIFLSESSLQYLCRWFLTLYSKWMCACLTVMHCYQSWRTFITVNDWCTRLFP